MVEGVHNTVNRGTVLHTQYGSHWNMLKGGWRYRGKVRYGNCSGILSYLFKAIWFVFKCS
jgi:hypothetical protein